MDQMKVINKTEGDIIRYAVVDDDGVTLYATGGRIGFIKMDPDRIVEERAEAWLAGYKAGLLTNERVEELKQDREIIHQDCERWHELSLLHARERDEWKAEAERWRVVADNAASDHAQADTDSLRALHERNELRRQLLAETCSWNTLTNQVLDLKAELAAAIRERDNAISDKAQADTDTIRALHERNELRQQLAEASDTIAHLRMENGLIEFYKMQDQLAAERALADQLAGAIAGLRDTKDDRPLEDIPDEILTKWTRLNNAWLDWKLARDAGTPD
jgi:chromosome segregation ATPase